MEQEEVEREHQQDERDEAGPDQRMDVHYGVRVVVRGASSVRKDLRMISASSVTA